MTKEDPTGSSQGPSTDRHGAPVVDPTKNVLDLVEAAVDALKESLKAGFERQDDLRALESTHFRELLNEKVGAMEIQFGLVERQRVEQKKDTKDAVDAALAAAKEAVKEQTTASGLSITKSETATAEQLKQLSTTFTTAINGLTQLQNDIKTRVERIENIKQGGREVFSGIYAVAGFLGVVVLILGAVIAFAP